MERKETDVLMRFLSFRPEDSKPVLSEFVHENGAISHFDGGKNNFVYIPGSREDRVLLVAHADTVWDRFYFEDPNYYYDTELAEQLSHMEHKPVLDGDIVRQGGWREWGLGADDRAGCAMLWLLKDSGHSLLITDGEEHGQIGAHYLKESFPALFEELNAHRYMIQLDRRNAYDYKTYNLPVGDDFIRYIEDKTGYFDAGRNSRTDIVTLCERAAGVNLSIGYHNEHHPEEYLNVQEWLGTYNIVKSMLEAEQPRFLLQAVGI